MKLIPVPTPIVRAGDDLALILRAAADIEDGDIIVISSKAIATAEGAAVDLSGLNPTPEAYEWSAKTGRSPGFIQAVLDETTRLNGHVNGSCPGALLCEVRPEGLSIGTILTANAGMDESNIDPGFTVGWPHDPVMSAKRLVQGLNRNCAVIVCDSCCRPRRLGVTAFALTACGMDPLKSEVGHTDLFGRELRVTVEALADQLATAANILMGNAGQSTPAAIIRDHGIPLSSFCGWVDGIEPEEDLFRSMME
jgi:coenzyme F420-0:L-glutamate ligase/coenzyme F420-1:gamma-L-glutamate ligase